MVTSFSLCVLIWDASFSWIFVGYLLSHHNFGKCEPINKILSQFLPLSWGSVLSHAHTVVWKCCNDDRQSQWGMAKFDPQPTLNPWTDRHQIWNTWLGRGHIPPKKFRFQSAQGFLPPHVRNRPNPSNVYCTFFQFFRAPTEKAVGPIFAFDTSYDVVLRKVVPFGG